MEEAQRDPVKPRIGAAQGEFEVPDSFFEPLPDELLKTFGAPDRESHPDR
jgi:hypothetical protein